MSARETVRKKEKHCFFYSKCCRKMKYQHDWTLYLHLTEFIFFISQFTDTHSCMLMANNGFTRWKVKLSCQTSRRWGSKFTNGTFSINSQDSGKQTPAGSPLIWPSVSVFGSRFFVVVRLGKGWLRLIFKKEYWLDQQLFCVFQRAERNRTIAAAS